MTVPFVHLRLHSEYSLVDGLVKLKSLVSTTAERRMPALALTDEANLFGLVKFYKAAQGAGLKPIIGSDLWLSNPHDEAHPYRITLLAMNDVGYRNLTELISKAGPTVSARDGRSSINSGYWRRAKV